MVAFVVQPADTRCSVFENHDCQIGVLEMGLASNDDRIAFRDKIFVKIHSLNAKTAEIGGIEQAAKVNPVIGIA